MNTGELLTEIRAAFPFVAMPAERDLRFHSDGCAQCRYLSQYLDVSAWLGKPVMIEYRADSATANVRSFSVATVAI